MKQFIIAMAVLSMLSACKESQRREGTAMYKTITVEPTNRTLKSGYTATLRGRQFVEVRPQVSGIITEIKINEGDAVHKGQTLFIIDQVPYKAALETAVANVKSAEAKLATARLSAESKAELFKEQVVSEFDLQTAKNELAEAEAGPDWICSNCTAHNKMAYANCVGCGSAYRKEDGDGFLQQKEYDENKLRLTKLEQFLDKGKPDWMNTETYEDMVIQHGYQKLYVDQLYVRLLKAVGSE